MLGIFPTIAIFHRDNDQQNHWVQWGTQHFQTHPIGDLSIASRQAEVGPHLAARSALLAAEGTGASCQRTAAQIRCDSWNRGLKSRHPQFWRVKSQVLMGEISFFFFFYSMPISPPSSPVDQSKVAHPDPAEFRFTGTAHQPADRRKARQASQLFRRRGAKIRWSGSQQGGELAARAPWNWGRFDEWCTMGLRSSQFSSPSEPGSFGEVDDSKDRNEMNGILLPGSV